MAHTVANLTIRRILTSWSTTLELDQVSGESIVTQPDLDRVVEVLSKYTDTKIPKDATIPIFHHSNTPDHLRP